MVRDARADPKKYVKQWMIVSGEVLSKNKVNAVIVDIKGEVDMIGLKNGDDYTYKGTGTLSGEIGVCPFCVDFSKSIGFTAKVHLEVGPEGVGDASVSWDVDF